MERLGSDQHCEFGGYDRFGVIRFEVGFFGGTRLGLSK